MDEADQAGRAPSFAERRQALRPKRRRGIARFGKKQRIIAGIMALVMVAGVVTPILLFTRQAAAAWCSASTACNTNWVYREKITINNAASGSNLSNFPLLVVINASRLNYANVKSDGSDLRFVDVATPSAVLSYEIDSWNPSGTSYIWVKVPQIDANSTTDAIYMYYGNASAAAGQNPSGVWDSNFRSVLHMNNDPSGSAPQEPDSTTNGYGATVINGMSATDLVNGQITNSINFNGTASMTQSANIDDTTTRFLTLSGWFRPASLTGNQNIMRNDDTNGNRGYFFRMNGANIQGNVYTGAQHQVLGTTTLVIGNWYYGAVRYDGSAVRVYVNGLEEGTASGSTANMVLSTTVSRIGTGTAAGSEIFKGQLDDLRYSTVARSADWIRAEYLTGTDAMNSFGTEEPVAPDAPLLTAFTTNATPLFPVFRLRASDQSEANYLRYRIQICTVADCSSVLRTIDQTASQTGWSGQDAQSGTAYVASSDINGSTLATYTYQSPGLTAGTQYWWRAYAIDPGGSNVWSAVSGINAFWTTGPPAAPTLLLPGNGASAVNNQTQFVLSTTDPDKDNVRYRILVCQSNDCTTVVRTIDQTQSQTGWASQNADNATSYSTGQLIGDSSQGVHVYQAPFLQPNTQYWWMAYAIDPAGSNTWSPASPIYPFNTGQNTVRILGGTTIRGGTDL